MVLSFIDIFVKSLQSLVMTSMTTMSIMLHMRVMTNYMAAVMNFLVFFFTVSVHNLLTLLNIGGVNNLLALLVLLVMALWTMGISLRVSMMSSFSISFTLVISTMTIRSMMFHMRVMTNNMGAMLNLSVFLLTMSVCNILTLFNIGGVHNVFTLVMFLMLWYLVALVVLLVMATRTT